jgi:hypothetical protein
MRVAKGTQLQCFEPSGAHSTHKTAPLLIIDFFSNGSLRLSPGERGKIATFRKMRLPVALELLELLATVNIPQPSRPVARPTDELPRISWVKLDAGDTRAAIFSWGSCGCSDKKS